MTSYACMNCKQIEDDAYKRHFMYQVHYPYVNYMPRPNPVYGKFTNFAPQHENFYPKYWNAGFKPKTITKTI